MDKFVSAFWEYMRWYRRQFLPIQQYSITINSLGGQICINFSYDMTKEVDNCLHKCRRRRNYDDCLTACYEDVFDEIEEFLCEQVDGFEKLLRRRGVEAKPDCSGGYSGSEGTIRWVRLCMTR